MDGIVLVFTWSENPYADMWNHLLFLAKKNNVERLLSGEIESGRTQKYHEKEVLEKKAIQVSFGISQSFEYFRAADTVGVATSPLLYFYGALSLAKSLVVANEKEAYFEGLKYHGLTGRPIDSVLETYSADPKLWKMEDEYAILRKGVSKCFTEVVCGFHLPDNSVVLFKDLLAVCPEIAQMFEIYYGEPSRTLYLYQFKQISEKPYKIEICPCEVDEKRILERIPSFGRDFDLSPAILHSQARIFSSRNLSKFPDDFGLFYPPVGGQYVVGGLDHRVGSSRQIRYVSPLISDYISLYLLSMCVRYKQDFWRAIIQGDRSGVLGLIELYLSVIKRRFPNLILNLLFGYEFSYGTPARLQ